MSAKITYSDLGALLSKEVPALYTESPVEGRTKPIVYRVTLHKDLFNFEVEWAYDRNATQDNWHRVPWMGKSPSYEYWTDDDVISFLSPTR